MAILDSQFSFTGRLGDFVAYRLPGVDGIILRQKGGVSARRIKEDANFENTRSVNAEFSGRSATAKAIMRMMYPLKALSDYNIAGPLNAILRPIQKADLESKNGMRHVQLTKNPGLLAGFPLNRKITFDAIIRCPLKFILSKEDHMASIIIPALHPRINLHTSSWYPLYSIVAVIGIVPDLFYSPNGYRPSHEGYNQFSPASVASDWFSITKGSPEIELHLACNHVPPDSSFSIMLSIGIKFGTVSDANFVEQIRNAGAAKVLAVH